MKVSRFAVLTLAVISSMPSALAQEDGDRPGRDRNRDRGGERGGERPEGQRGPGRGFGGMGGMMGMFGGMMGSSTGNGTSQLLGMLRMDEVRKELGLTDEVYEAVQSRQQESFSLMREMRGATDERRKEISQQIDTEAQELLDEILTPEKQKRLMGLMVQFSRGLAVLNPMVAKELSLGEEALAGIRTEMASFGDKMRERFASAREGGGIPDFTKIQEELETVRDEMDEMIFSKLSDDQKAQLESLKGEKFEFPEMNMFQGGFGRGDRPPRGEGGQDRGRDRRGRDRS